MPSAEEATAQQINHLQKEFEDEHLRNHILDGMVWLLVKIQSIEQTINSIVQQLRRKDKLSISRCCRLVGISRQDLEVLI